ncbi:MAG: hypothetical protein HY814_07030 [Candidatus Riflebacteria bacterium]|nr:hypothetical protein [Candidatus Riflebacteria bacterium]
MNRWSETTVWSILESDRPGCTVFRLNGRATGGQGGITRSVSPGKSYFP